MKSTGIRAQGHAPTGFRGVWEAAPAAECVQWLRAGIRARGALPQGFGFLWEAAPAAEGCSFTLKVDQTQKIIV
jgi:hypothetical protein